MHVQHFFDPASYTISYVVSDPATSQAAIIDSVLGYSPVSGRIDSSPAEVLINYVRERNLGVAWILETHAHADHLSGAQFIKAELGGKVAIGAGIRAVQAHFEPLFNLATDSASDGSHFDCLLVDAEVFNIGDLQCKVLATPGHTGDSVSYQIGDAVFVGDSLFMPDYGTARCDFPGGDAAVLYASIQTLLSLPDDTHLYMCHDYLPNGRELRYRCTVAEQREHNVHVGNALSESEFVKLRNARDSTLDLPALIVPAIQVNIRAGQLPEAEENGIAYLKVPLDTF